MAAGEGGAIADPGRFAATMISKININAQRSYVAVAQG
jgi:hypothetical protein